MRSSIIRNLEMRVNMGTSIHALIEPPRGFNTNPRPRKTRTEAHGAGHHTVVRGAGRRTFFATARFAAIGWRHQGLSHPPPSNALYRLRNTMAVRPFPLSYAAGIHRQVYSSIFRLAA